jgi:prolyl-tRNA editing enzyme YbaK/EbsC (Cys-tRNA(Pro) deacylase)
MSRVPQPMFSPRLVPPVLEAAPSAVLDTVRTLHELGIEHEVSRNPAVISCQEAATARGIPLAQELHSRVLTLRPRSLRAIVLVHFAADRRIDERALQVELGTPSRPRGASERELTSLGLDRGTVTPFVHLHSPQVTHVFDLGTVEADGAHQMMTNAGDLTWSVRFSLPQLVDALGNVRVLPGITDRRDTQR